MKDIKFTWYKKRSDFKVDTHIILHHSKKNKKLIDKCLKNLQGEKTNILLVDSDNDNIGYLRAEAIKQCKSEYICFVDDDDYYLKNSNAFNKCIEFLDNNKEYVGVYTDYVHKHGNHQASVIKSEWSYIKQLTHPFEVLHLHIFRREPCLEFLDDLSKYKTLEEAFLLGAIVKYGKWKHLPILAYVKNVTENGAGSKINNKLIHEMTAEIAKYFLTNGKIKQND